MMILLYLIGRIIVQKKAETRRVQSQRQAYIISPDKSGERENHEQENQLWVPGNFQPKNGYFPV